MRSYFAMCIAPLLGISSGAYAAEIKVLCDGPLRPALTQIAPAFERDSGHQMKVEFGLSPLIHEKLIDEELADVIIIQPNFIEELVTAGKLAAGEHPIIARVGIGLMVRTGADAPDVSTAELLKEALLAADFIVFSNVAGGNAFAKVLEQLGIAHTVKDKVAQTAPAEVIARILQSKGRDIGVGATTLILDRPAPEASGPLTSCAAKLSCLCSRIDHRRSTIRARENINLLSGFTCGQETVGRSRRLLIARSNRASSRPNSTS